MSFPDLDSDALDSDRLLSQAADRLRRVQVIGRWCFNGVISLLLLPWSLWTLRQEIALWREHFTWVALRYGLGYHPGATLGIVTSVALVTATLIWHSRNILLGFPQKEQYRLEQQALKIREQGKRSLLWRWVWQDL